MDAPVPDPSTTACHVVTVPYPGRGHVNPMMNLAKLLLSKNPNIIVTFLVTEEWLGLIGPKSTPRNFRFATIPNVIPSEHGRANDFLGFIESVMTKMEEPFEHFLEQLDPKPNLIIYDTYLFWVVRVANSRKIPVASFWPMSASFYEVLKHYHLLEQNGDYPVNLSENGDKRVDYIPGNTSIRLADFPLTDESWRIRKMLKFALDTIPWVQKSQYFLFPSIYELEPLAIDSLREEYSIPIYTIGPCIPYFGHNNNNNNHITNNDEIDYMNWLDKQPCSSVLYVSQGSFLSTSSDQIDELAFGLRESGVSFLWVQQGDASRLKEICGDNGLVLPWCEQLRVLQHNSVGGFWSHCGWNSTREGVFSGVPFLAFPLFMDQPLNSKYIVEEWKVGWRVKTEAKQGLIRRDEIADIIRRFMDLESDEGKEMRKRAKEFQQICQHAIEDGGSSEANINAFVRHAIQGAKP